MPKKVKKKKYRIKLIFALVLFGGLASWFGYNFYNNYSKILEKQGEKDALLSQISSLKDKEEELKTDILKLEDPSYVARYAREKYLYSKDGEYIIRIPDSEQ